MESEIYLQWKQKCFFSQRFLFNGELMVIQFKIIIYILPYKYSHALLNEYFTDNCLKYEMDI